MISGFMIVKNVLQQGYPFVEAIASALPICDEFLISDGYSTDGTFKVIEKIAALNPKVKVYKYQWPDKKDFTVLADVTNELQKKCRFEYIFSVQANEIIHEQNAALVKALPTIHPYVETFSFPYLQFANEYVVNEEYRIRFSKNLPSIESIFDAWTFGLTKKYLRKKKLKALANPRRLSGYLDKGISFVYANVSMDQLSRAVYLPKPMFRYWALFPKNFLEKCQKHAEYFTLPEFKQSFSLLQTHVTDHDKFWKEAAEFLRKVEFKERGLQYPDRFGFLDKKEHPAIVQEFLSEAVTSQYHVRDELFDRIRRA